MTEYGTTLEEKLKEFEMTVLFKHPEKRQATVVGIVGMGGIGKTTLAKEFFKRRRSDYAGSCFLLNVRENAARGNLTSLQSKLINDLQGNIHIKIGSVDEGKGILGHYLKYCHALIVLDDVDVDYLLGTLLAMKNVLDPKSLILVTTRSKNVLSSAGMENYSIYELSGINQEGSRKIFCLYAFSQPYPPPGFEPLVEEISKGCEGLPLLLKAFGGLLCGENDLAAWKTVLWRISKMEHKDIFGMLMICYDYLVEEEQEIFLDIAYFSVGKDRDTWIGLWDESGWKGLVGFQNLKKKGLVELDSENKIVMHDVVRDFGRYITRDLGRHRDSPYKALLHFWGTTIRDLEEQLSSGINQVRAIRMHPGDGALERWGMRSDLDFSPGEDSFNNRIGRFGMFSDLHFLEGEGSFIEYIITRKVRSPKLMWLHWINCPHSSLPSWLPVHDLRVLEVTGQELEILWKCESQAPMHLRELIVDAPLLKFPKSLGQLKHLKMIEAKESNLATLPEEICYLPFLKCLKLKDYEILPDSDGNFTNIQLTDGRNLENISDSMDNLKNLNLTDLERCTSLEMLITAIVWRHFQSPWGS